MVVFVVGGGRTEVKVRIGRRRVVSAVRCMADGLLIGVLSGCFEDAQLSGSKVMLGTCES